MTVEFKKLDIMSANTVKKKIFALSVIVMSVKNLVCRLGTEVRLLPLKLLFRANFDERLQEGFKTQKTTKLQRKDVSVGSL